MATEYAFVTLSQPDHRDADRRPALLIGIGKGARIGAIRLSDADLDRLALRAVELVIRRATEARQLLKED